MSLFCESCGVHAALPEQVPMPGVAVRVFMCKGCLRANAWPYPIVVAQQAIMGPEAGSRAWQELVEDTLTGHTVTRQQFSDDVSASTRLLES